MMSFVFEEAAWPTSKNFTEQFHLDAVVPGWARADRIFTQSHQSLFLAPHEEENKQTNKPVTFCPTEGGQFPVPIWCVTVHICTLATLNPEGGLSFTCICHISLALRNKMKLYIVWIQTWEHGCWNVWGLVFIFGFFCCYFVRLDRKFQCARKMKHSSRLKESQSTPTVFFL